MATDRQLRPRPTDSRRSFAAAHAQKAPSRPARLLNTGSKKFQSRPERIANATQSRLLLLPPELRDRIWRLVLGGRTLHFWNNFEEGEKQFRYTVCSATKSVGEAAREIRNATDTQDISYVVHHEECATDPNTSQFYPCRKLDLSILQVSSQIHQEAALIAFTDNVFAFRWNNTIDRLLPYLFPVQLRAIQSTCIESTALLGQPIHKLLPGLKHLVAICSYYGSEIESLRTKPVAGANFVTSMLSLHERGTYLTATIALYGIAAGYMYKPRIPDRALYNEASKLLENWLTLPEAE